MITRADANAASEQAVVVFIWASPQSRG